MTQIMTQEIGYAVQALVEYAAQGETRRAGPALTTQQIEVVRALAGEALEGVSASYAEREAAEAAVRSLEQSVLGGTRQRDLLVKHAREAATRAAQRKYAE